MGLPAAKEVQELVGSASVAASSSSSSAFVRRKERIWPEQAGSAWGGSIGEAEKAVEPVVPWLGLVVARRRRLAGVNVSEI